MIIQGETVWNLIVFIDLLNYSPLVILPNSFIPTHSVFVLRDKQLFHLIE